MKFTAILCASIFIALSANAQKFVVTEAQASQTIKKYSEAVACADDSDPRPPMQYKAVKFYNGNPETFYDGDKFLVHWFGDIGCAAGSGTTLRYFTIVEQRTNKLFVNPDIVFPDIQIDELKEFSARNGIVKITGMNLAEGAHKLDKPTIPVSYTFKFNSESNKFIRIK